MNRLRQGWERLCGAGQAEFFVPVAGARSARDHGAGFTKTGLAQAAFERTARSRLVNALRCAAMQPSVAACIKLSHQILFFLPITALTILAIALRLCLRMAGFVLDKNNGNFSDILHLLQRCVNECGRRPKNKEKQVGERTVKRGFKKGLVG